MMTRNQFVTETARKIVFKMAKTRKESKMFSSAEKSKTKALIFSEADVMQAVSISVSLAKRLEEIGYAAWQEK